MTIRPARPEEASLLSELAFRSKAHWGYSPAFMYACRDELSVSEEAIRSGQAFVLAQRGSPLGFYTLEPLSTERVELGHLFVEPTCVRTGYGRRLLAHAAEEALHRGFATLVIQGDPNAAAFYESCGAKRVGTEPSASIPGRSLPLFELRLSA